MVSIALAWASPAGEVARQASGVLSLRGGSVGGVLLDGPAPGAEGRPVLRWQSPLFVRPLEFPMESVAGIVFDASAGRVPGDNETNWRIELAGGDAIVGSLERIDDGLVVVRSAGPAAPVAIPIRRSLVRSIGRVGMTTTSIWNGGLDGWTLSAPGDWEKTGRGVTTTVPGATMTRPIGAAPRQRVDLALAWRGRPALRITIRPAATGTPSTPGADEAAIAVRGMGDDGPPKPPPPAPYVVEISDGQVVAIRDEADAGGRGRALTRPCGSAPDQGLSLGLFIDRSLGRMVVKRGDAEKATVDVAISPAAASPSAELVIEAVSGTVSLEGLRVGPWQGESLDEEDDRAGVVILRDGESLDGVAATSPDDPARLIVRSEGSGPAPRSIALEAVTDIRFPVARAGDARAGAAGGLRFIDRNGSLLSGRLESIVGGEARIDHPAIEGTLTLSLGDLVSIESVAAPPEPAPLPARVGRLSADGVSLEGCLVPLEAAAGEAGPAGRIGWLPAGGVAASPFAAGPRGSPEGVIRYVAPATDHAVADRLGWIGAHIGMLDDKPAILGVQADSPLAAEAAIVPALLLAVAPSGDGRFVSTDTLPIEDVTALVRGRVGSEVHLRIRPVGGDEREVRVVRAVPRFISDQQSLEQVLAAHRRLLSTVDGPVDGAAENGFGSLVFLVSGEAVPCRVETIVEGGIAITRDGLGTVTIPAEHVQAVELVPGEAIALSPEKYRSLTTLPRAQRAAPPTHLVRSSRGDYLRGRLVGMDGTSLRILMDSDPRGKPVAIPRAEVARVIWLHPESLAEDWTPPALPRGAGLSLEAISGKRTRTRIAAESIRGDVLVGAHPVLGLHEIDLGSIDRLVFGEALEDAPLMPPYGQWHLRPATEPRNLPKRPR